MQFYVVTRTQQSKVSDNDDIHRDMIEICVIRMNVLIHNVLNLLKYCCSSHFVFVFIIICQYYQYYAYFTHGRYAPMAPADHRSP